jgi:hypothetical protein
MKYMVFTSNQKTDLIGTFRKNREQMPQCITPSISLSPEKSLEKTRDRPENIAVQPTGGPRFGFAQDQVHELRSIDQR